MLGHQDEIATNYRKCCAEFRARLDIRINEIYKESQKGGYQKNISTNHEKYLDDAFNSLVNFERKLLQYIRIKQQYQSENKALQMTIKELQLNLKSKNVCISKLKDDIASHYLQVELLRKHNSKIEGDLLCNKRKLDQYEKSKQWLKKQIYSIDNEHDHDIISNEPDSGKIDISNNIFDKQEVKHIMKQKLSHKTDELTQFHVKLIEAYHENKFLRQALQKMKNLSAREDRLNRLLKSSREITAVTKLEEPQKVLHNRVNAAKINERVENEKTLQLNSIINCMRATILQLEFEKRNTELLVFKLSEYFMKMKIMHSKLKIMLNDKSHEVKIPMLSEVSSSRSNRNFPSEGNKIHNLSLEKLQMETDHLDELKAFTEKCNRIQFILNDIKAVCDQTASSEQIELRVHQMDDIVTNFRTTVRLNMGRNSENEISTKLYNLNSGGDQKTRKSCILSTPRQLSDKNDVPIERKFEKISRYILRRLEIIEERYRRISSTCSKNLYLLKELNEKPLISEMRQMKIWVLVKEKQSTEQRERFDKYKRCLLNTIKVYRKSCIVRKKQNDKLQELYIPIVLELKLLKKNLIQYEQNMTIPSLAHHDYKSENNILAESLCRIETLTEKIKNNIDPNVQKLKPSQGLGADGATATLSEGNRMTSQSDLEDTDTVHLEEQNFPPNGALCRPITYGVIGLDRNVKNITCTCIHEETNISSSVIENLRREKSILQAALRHRDLILGKIFNSFKCKIEGMSIEINEKYFLQRLCNDLRTVIKIYGGQNKVMKEALENNNICTKSVYIQGTLRRSTANKREEHVRELLKQGKNLGGLQETFSDIHSHLESMKRQMSILQNVISIK